MKTKWLSLIAVLGLVSCKQQSPVQQADLDAWNDEIIYFALTDRFQDGNPANNSLGFNEYDTSREHHFHGGDFEGLKNGLPYLRQLGITALWITPPVRNTIWSRDSSVSGYHGYWASHFMQTDPHLGTIEDYKALAHALHSTDMKLIQDVVTNHTGDYFTYTGSYDANSPAKNFHKRGKPLQAPFDQNDAANPADLARAIYHFTPNIQDYSQPQQKLSWQMSDLDDLNTENDEVIAALKKSFRFWMDSIGIDGIRFDTPLYVDHPFWNRFLHDAQSQDPGLKKHASRTKKPHFYTFGETWVHSNPFESAGESKALRYLGTKGKPEMDGILHFPMQQSIHRVFAGGASTAELTHRLRLEDSLFVHPWQRLHFIDNHDMPRFRSSASESATRQALAFIMTIPGIPVLYYGTEQGLKGSRENLFNKLDSTSETFGFVRSLIALRKSTKAFSRGRLRVIADAHTQPGLFAYELAHEGEQYWVFFNTSENELQGGGLALATQQGQFDIALQQGEVQFGAISAGKLSYLRLGAKAMAIVKLQSSARKRMALEGKLLLHPIPDTLSTPLLQTSGRCSNFDSLKLYIDGLVALPVEINSTGDAVRALVPLNNIPDGRHHLVWIGYEKGTAVLAAKQTFVTALPQKSILAADDPTNDDRGPKLRYVYPKAFENLKSLDLTGARVTAKGHSIGLEISFNQAFSTVWNPPLGFDHLQLTVLMRLNNQKGTTVLEEAHYTMPNGSSFTHMISLNGWQMQAFRSDGAGKPKALAAAPALTLLGPKTLQLTIDPALLGFPASIHEMEFHILTWDSAGEGGLRPITPAGADYAFGGGSHMDPKWIDRMILQVKF